MENKISLQVEINTTSTLQKTWDYFTNPSHITQWYFASDDWCCPNAQNDLKTNGKFLIRMQSKDGTMGFDFEGIYSTIEFNKKIDYYLADGRTVSTLFETTNNNTKVTQIFDAENENPIEMQQAGWQAILNNFKTYVENN